MFLSQYFQTVNILSKLLTILTVETVEFNKNPFEIAILETTAGETGTTLKHIWFCGF